MTYNENTKAEILRLYQLGDSAAQIARRMGPPHTRNSVLGVVHRAAHKGEIKTRTEAARDAHGTTPAQPVTGGCRFPIGDPCREEPVPGTPFIRRVPDPTYRTCGAATPAGRTYCEQHHAVCYTGRYQARVSAAEITPIHQRARGRFQ